MKRTADTYRQEAGLPKPEEQFYDFTEWHPTRLEQRHTELTDNQANVRYGADRAAQVARELGHLGFELMARQDDETFNQEIA